jgi:GNAT superfamily N-acetyltransferase
MRSTTSSNRAAKLLLWWLLWNDHPVLIHVVDCIGHPLVPAAREMFVEYQQELGVDLCFQDFEQELSRLPGKYAPPRGALILFEIDGYLAACGAMRDIDEGNVELKRIYVRPEARGTGLGKLMTETLVDRAKLIGYGAVRCDTLRRLGPANALYQALGFVEIQPYNFNPEIDVVYLEMKLASP